MNQDRPPDRAGEIFAALGKSVCYVALFLGIQVAVMLPAICNAVVQQVVNGLSSEEVYRLLTADTMTLTLVSGLATIGVVLAFYLVRRKKLGEALWLRAVPGPALLSVASLMPLLYLLVTTALMLLPEAWLESYNQASAGIATGTLVGVIDTVVVAPIAEEFIFRGLVLNRLSRVMPGWLAVVLSAAVFGACHGHPVWFAYAFVLGAVFALADLRAGSILPSILGHVFFNLIGQVITFIPETESGAEIPIIQGVLLVLGLVLLLANRKGVAALLHPAGEPSGPPEGGDCDPWEE